MRGLPLVSHVNQRRKSTLKSTKRKISAHTHTHRPARMCAGVSTCTDQIMSLRQVVLFAVHIVYGSEVCILLHVFLGLSQLALLALF